MRRRNPIATRRRWRIAAALLLPIAAVADEHTGRLEITVRGLRSADGSVAVALFADAASFDERAEPLRKARLAIDGGESHWSLDGLPAGDYALLAYHDENGNGELDFRPLGIPKEPIAVSNGAKRFLGPPRFESAKFAVGNDVSSITLELH